MTQAADRDPWLWRKVTRYKQFLAPRETVFGDPAVLAAARRVAPAQPHPSGPDRGEMVELITEAAKGSTAGGGRDELAGGIPLRSSG